MGLNWWAAAGSWAREARPVTGGHLDARQAGKCSPWLGCHVSAAVLHLEGGICSGSLNCLCLGLPRRGPGPREIAHTSQVTKVAGNMGEKTHRALTCGSFPGLWLSWSLRSQAMRRGLGLPGALSRPAAWCHHSLHRLLSPWLGFPTLEVTQY